MESIPAGPPESGEASPKPRAYELRVFLSFTESAIALAGEVMERAISLVGKKAVIEPARMDKYFVISQDVGVKLAGRDLELVPEIKSLSAVCATTGAQVTIHSPC